MFTPTPSPVFTTSTNRLNDFSGCTSQMKSKRGRGEYEYDEEYDGGKKQRENRGPQSLLVVKNQRGG